jgi:hypothetical protein
MTCLEQIVVTVAKQATKQEMIRHLKPPCRPTAFPIRVGVPPPPRRLQIKPSQAIFVFPYNQKTNPRI